MNIKKDIFPLVLDWFYKNYPYSVLLKVNIQDNKNPSDQKVTFKKVSENRKFKYQSGLEDGIVLQNAKAFLVTCDGTKCRAEAPNGEQFNFSLTTKWQKI